MKIGEVSRRYGISIDTLNYYIQFGLLVPPKKGGQRDFDARTISELEQILSLKELRFTLQEIYRIITMSRISHFASEEDQSDLAALYRLKREQCLKEAQAYSEAARILSEKISSLQIPVVSSRNTGVPLRMFDLLRCPDCGNPFTVSNPVMDSASMDSADLSCSCGYQAKIRSGIVITDSSGPRPYDKADVNRETYRDLPPDLITLFQNAYNWMTSRILSVGTANRVVLETNINAWCFLHNHLEFLDPKGLYILTDRFPETLLAYKKLIDAQGYPLNFLYIADSSANLPLQKKCVDLSIDFFAVNEYSFYNRSFLWSDLLPVLHPDTKLVGTYFSFQNGKQSMKQLLSEYPNCSPQNFSRSDFLRSMSSGGFILSEKEEIGATADSGNNIGFSFHRTGEKMQLLSYLARVGPLS